jgi:prepilin-type processing-associated H-X9-DG protein
MRRPRLGRWIWIIAGILAGLLSDQLRRLPWIDWSERYGPSIAQRKFEEDLRTHRPGSDHSRRLVIYAEQLRDIDGTLTPVNIVVSKRIDHYEYRNGQPGPIWEEVSYVAPVPYISSASHKSFPTVMAFLDDPSSGGGAGAVPYVVAWWAKPPMSKLLSAAIGALLVGILWPLAIRRAKDLGPFLLELFLALLTRLRLYVPVAKAPVPVPAVHPTGGQSIVKAPEPDLEDLQTLNDELESRLSRDPAPDPVIAAPLAAATVAELIGGAIKPAAPAASADAAEFGAATGDYYPTVVHAHKDHPNDPPKPPPEPRQGFTIGELIAVLGVIGILIAFVTPLVRAVRARAAQINCAESLRTMGIAAQTHAAQHQGYLPLCGRHWRVALLNGQMTPSGLEDPGETHYVYYTDAGQKYPAPITAALAVSLGIAVDRTSRTALAADLQSDRLRNFLRCPAQDPPARGYSLGSDDWEAPAEFSGYVYNEALLAHRVNRPWLPQGQPARVQTPSQLFFAMDGDPRERFFHIWELNLPSATLQDFREKEGKCIDDTRHACRANVLFVDWHVANVPLTEAGLKSIVIAEFRLSLPRLRLTTSTSRPILTPQMPE